MDSALSWAARGSNNLRVSILGRVWLPAAMTSVLSQRSGSGNAPLPLLTCKPRQQEAAVRSFTVVNAHPLGTVQYK